MTITRVRVPLTQEEFNMLLALCERDLRDPASELRFLLLEELRRSAVKADPASHVPGGGRGVRGA